jgi:hypothetical protein
VALPKTNTPNTGTNLNTTDGTHVQETAPEQVF